MHIDASARVGSLPAAVMLDKGVLKITPIEKSTPPEAEALATRLYAMLPRIRITDLLSEVARCLRGRRRGPRPAAIAAVAVDAEQPRPPRWPRGRRPARWHRPKRRSGIAATRAPASPAHLLRLRLPGSSWF